MVFTETLEEIKDKLDDCKMLVTNTCDLRDYYRDAIDEIIRYNDKFLNLPRLKELGNKKEPGLYYSIDPLDSSIMFFDYKVFGLISIYDIEEDSRMCSYRIDFELDKDRRPLLFIRNNITKEKRYLDDTSECALSDLIRIVSTDDTPVFRGRLS